MGAVVRNATLPDGGKQAGVRIFRMAAGIRLRVATIFHKRRNVVLSRIFDLFKLPSDINGGNQS